MKKLDKKGFFSIAIIYSFLILFILLLLAIISSYLNRYNLLNSLIGVAQEEIAGEIKETAPARNEVVDQKDEPGEYEVTLNPGRYQMELWGAQGGYSKSTSDASNRGGYGSYTNAEIEFTKKTTITIYVGGKGTSCTETGSCAGGKNGGGAAIKNASNSYYGTGGGASDIRIGNKDATKNDLGTRIMVAGGGGGAAYVEGSLNKVGGDATGFGWQSGSKCNPTQLSHGLCGSYATDDVGSTPTDYGPGGGGGFFGGGTTSTESFGGSSYISGFNCTNDTMCAESREVKFENGVIIDGGGHGWQVIVQHTSSGTISRAIGVSARQKIPRSHIDMNNDGDEEYYDLGVGKSGNGGYRISKIDKQRLYYNINDFQTFVAPRDGEYKFELWGAQGGTVDTSMGEPGGAGGYTSGRIDLKKGDTLYLFVGGQGTNLLDTLVTYPKIRNVFGGYNGGRGKESKAAACGNDIEGLESYGCILASGGGATDIRTYINENGEWDDEESLRSRIMVAAGGAGGTSSDKNDKLTGGQAGGLKGYPGSTDNLLYETYMGYGSSELNISEGGTQLSGGNASAINDRGTFGGNTVDVTYALSRTSGGSGGGSGYYSGATGQHKAGGGGSSFISGHLGCIAVASQNTNNPRNNANGNTCTETSYDLACSQHYSKIYNSSLSVSERTPAIFKLGTTVMIDGQGMEWTTGINGMRGIPNPYSNDYYPLGNGNTGNGMIRITLPDTEADEG